jgi:DNA mismatch repair protein MutL
VTADPGQGEKGRIRQLPEAVANRIAAGEVVERPVAVVKELVENALDAGAGTVDIQFERGGKALIRVADNGFGMTSEEAVLALRRHATSKIRDVEDILRIGSFGFRGEALPSIASVSRFVLRTRPPGQAEGTEVRLGRDGQPEARSCGMSPGTEVAVENLFQSVPARRKFLKTERTESAHIVHLSRLLAVAHPEVGFSLTEDGHELFRSPACPDRRQRVREIFGRNRAEEMLPFTAKAEPFAMEGLLGRPGSGRSTRAEMITYVNRRPVSNRVLAYALIESYHRFLPRGRYPVAFLFLEIPPEQVDVNVHPGKREIRFRNEPAVRQAVMTALTGFLQATTEAQLGRASGEEAQRIPPSPPPAPAPAVVPSKPLPASPPPAKDPFPAAPREPRSLSSDSGERRADVPGGNKPWTFAGRLQERIGLFSAESGLVLLNPRAAQERVLLERISRESAGAAPERQALLMPPVLELPALEAGVLADQIDFFNDLGFEMEPFGRHAFRLRSAPAWLRYGDPEAMVRDLVGRLRDRGAGSGGGTPSTEVIARRAAMREARGGAPPRNAEEWEALANSLLACENPLLDARGRPTFIEIRNGEIARKLMLENLGELDPLEGLVGPEAPED